MPALVIQGIEVPVPDVDKFFTDPNFQDIVDGYPEFCRQVHAARRIPFEPQPFLIAACNQLERHARDGRTAEIWFKCLMQRFGTQGLREILAVMQAAWDSTAITVQEP